MAVAHSREEVSAPEANMGKAFPGMFTQPVKVKDDHMGVALGYLGMVCVQIPRHPLSGMGHTLHALGFYHFLGEPR